MDLDKTRIILAKWAIEWNILLVSGGELVMSVGGITRSIWNSKQKEKIGPKKSSLNGRTKRKQKIIG